MIETRLYFLGFTSIIQNSIIQDNALHHSSVFFFITHGQLIPFAPLSVLAMLMSRRICSLILISYRTELPICSIILLYCWWLSTALFLLDSQKADRSALVFRCCYCSNCTKQSRRNFAEEHQIVAEHTQTHPCTYTLKKRVFLSKVRKKTGKKRGKVARISVS